MFATADCTTRYPEQTIYDSEWTENTPTGISWFNLLTSQPIPEETDSIHDTCTPLQSNRQSSCSSSSIESCYVVLEIQRNRSFDEIPNQVEKEDEEEEEEEEEEEGDEEEEEDEDEGEDEIQETEEAEEEQVQKVEEEEEEDDEEIEEEIEELNFAQTISDDNHNVYYEQFAIPMITEKPKEEYIVKCKQEKFIPVEEYATVNEPIIHEISTDMLFDKAKTLSKFTKRVKAMSYASIKEQQHYSPSSDDESLNITKLKTIRKVNEYHPMAIPTVTSEQQSNIKYSNSSYYSTTSLDSIENKSLSSSSPISKRITTTFSNLSSQRTSNSTQIQRIGPTMGTTTLTRTFAFDRACMEKYGREQENKFIETPLRSNNESIIKRRIELSNKKNEQTEQLSRSENALNRHSCIDAIPASFYIDNELSAMEDLEFEHRSTTPSSIAISNSQSKASSILCLMKKYARTVKSDYRLTHNKSNGNLSSEPTLLQVKYLDGRGPLNDDQARESFRKNSKLSDSVAPRLNRLSLHNMSSTQDLSSTSTSTTFYASYRKRMFNRFRSFVENNFNEPPSSSSSVPQSRPWQHKTISELLSEKKYTVNHHR